MTRLITLASRIFAKTEGASVVEYALTLFLIAVVTVAMFSLLGSRFSGVFNAVASSI